MGGVYYRKTGLPTNNGGNTYNLTVGNAGAHGHNAVTNSAGEHQHNYGNTEWDCGGKSNNVKSATQQHSFQTGKAGSHNHNISIDSASNHNHSVSGLNDDTRPNYCCLPLHY